MIATATAADITSADVAGNVPLHLAAVARIVYAVEFTGDAPRGIEYGLAEMDTAGARIARYSVTAIPTPPGGRELTYSDKRLARGYYPVLLVGRDNDVRVFEGRSIPHIVGVLRRDYTQHGKWSGTDYVLMLALDAWAYESVQDWESGWHFDRANTVEDVIATLRHAGCVATDAAIIATLESTFPQRMAHFRERAADLATLTQ